MRKLSDAQINALAEISNGRLTPTQALIMCGRSWRKTLDRLVTNGLAIYQPYALKGGAYKITAEGKTAVSALIARGRPRQE